MAGVLLTLFGTLRLLRHILKSKSLLEIQLKSVVRKKGEGLIVAILWPEAYTLVGRDNEKDFSFPVPSPFLKLNDKDVKSFLNGYPIF